MTDIAVVPAPLLDHWQAWTGADVGQLSRLGSGDDPMVQVVGSVGRTLPGWDGNVHAVTGIVDPAGSAIVSVPPEHADWAAEIAREGLDALRGALPERLGFPRNFVYRAICRWAVDVPGPDDLPDAGSWLSVDDPAVPDWLRPFGGEVLVVLDDGRYVAGLGLKRHDPHGREIAVGTEEAARGRGLARRLVAQVARALLADGIVPTYLHDPRNTASARVADAAGFPDRGWGALGMAAPQEVTEAAGVDTTAT